VYLLLSGTRLIHNDGTVPVAEVVLSVKNVADAKGLDLRRLLDDTFRVALNLS